MDKRTLQDNELPDSKKQAVASAPVTSSLSAGATKPVLYMVTGNRNKLLECRRLLGEDFPFTIENINVDLPELQGEPSAVALDKCKAASRVVNGPFIVEDISLGFSALGGLPGVYDFCYLLSLQTRFLS